ncbi:MAG: xanthine dehydrogenase family protein molybdopterin-binding subunit [Conexivisphaera sp.]|jgi:xanthine dehydrogenase molybdenum-binding subunit
MTSVELMAREFSHIGSRVPKYDAPEKVSGDVQYLLDLEMPGMLHAKVLRSPYPHARIVSVDVSGALRVPGVVDVITAKDVKLNNLGYLRDHPPLKWGKVRSVRDEVAAVAAVDPESALEAIHAIKVEYEPLPSVTDPLRALDPGAPLVHEEFGTNRANLDFSLEFGDVDDAISRADVVVEGTYSTQYVAHNPGDTMGALAWIDAHGTLNVIANTQTPFLYQRWLSESLGIPAYSIRVIQPYIGGAFGRNLDVYPHDVIAAALAMRTRRPVKLQFTRSEELQNAPTKQPLIARVRQGATRDGRLVAREVDAIIDAGAYVGWGVFDARVMQYTVTGLYRVPAVRFRTTVVYTNNPYTAAMRSAGNSQITFAVESNTEELAERLGMDPVEFRLLNANAPNTVTPQGAKITTCAMSDAIREAARRIGWRGRHSAGPNRGIGFACYFHVGGGARIYRSDGCGATLKVDDFGGVVVTVGGTEIGEGLDTGIQLITAEALGIPRDRVRVVINGDSTIRLWDVGTHASRGTFICGNAALRAALDAKRQILEGAAQLLGTQSSDLDLRDGFVYSRSDPSKRMEYEKIVRRMHFSRGAEGTVVVASSFYEPPSEEPDERWYGNVSAAYGFGCQAVLVEVDRETGRVKVLKVVSAHDAGRVINPNGFEGQVQGGVAMGIGLALLEELVLSDGRVVNGSFEDYRMPRVTDMPEIEVVSVGQPDPEGPFGVKGMAESPVIPTGPAIANAVADAIGVRVRDLPIIPEKVWRNLSAKTQ